MSRKAYYTYRLLEVLPGSLVWTTLILVVLLSVLKPLWMIYFAIIFDLYWLFRVIYFIIYLFLSWRQFRREVQINWLSRVMAIAKWQQIRHIIFLPTVDESIEVIRHTFIALAKSHYPKEKMVVVLAGEARYAEHFGKIAQKIDNEFSQKFYKLIITLHPGGQKGEIASKGANLHYAAGIVKKFVDNEGWSYENIIVSSFDIDTIVHSQYFSYLTYTYLNHPHPTRSSYQPIALYNNNIWETPSFTRVVAYSTTFWLMAELARPKPLWTFSSHSMSFKALVDVGYWQNDIVTEDSRIFLQCFIHYNGDYEVTPMYMPVSMDTAYAGSVWNTMRNLYKQQRRWAWGIEHFPYMLWHFLTSDSKIKGTRKWHLLFNLTEGMYSWATAPILITILGYLPLWFADDSLKSTVLAQYAPYILEWIMRLAMVGIFTSAILNVLLMPLKETKKHRWKIPIIILQWILLPLALIFFGSIPAIDAQSRLMLGKYLGFYATKKTRMPSSA